MPATQEPILGVYYGWSVGESGYANQMDANLTKLATLAQISVKNRTTASPPGTPVNGDRYLIAASPTGAWASHAGHIAVWRAPLSAWEFYVPANGWTIFVEAERVAFVYLSGSLLPLDRSGITALTDGATVNIDMSLSNNFSLTIGGNRTLGNPTNMTPGQSGKIVITQDATGGRTLSFGTYWKFSGGTAPTLTSAANSVDVLNYFIDSLTTITTTITPDRR